jgi:hypothetical protein
MRLSSQLHRKYKQEDHKPGCPGINMRPYWKNIENKTGGGMAQVVECLPSQVEVPE